MSEIIFNNDNNEFKFKSRVLLGKPEVPKVINFLLQKNIVKNEKQAKSIIFGFITLFFIISIYIFMVYVFEIDITNIRSQSQNESLIRIEKMIQNNTK